MLDPFTDIITWSWHGGYNIVSGPLADLPMLGIFAVLWRRHNCHIQGCWRIQWRQHDEHALCRKHHPADAPKAEDIRVTPLPPANLPNLYIKRGLGGGQTSTRVDL